ncbi:MAG: DUF1284 domain-containing protein [Hyphomonas sp.]|nr:DUF1284 domain-containing protein [Hyphomonas sp.]
MTVRLRPHHLLCVLTYMGRGYSPAFTGNLTKIAGRLAAGEAVDIVTGPDDICAPMLDGHDPHCHRDSVTNRDHAAARELSPLLGCEIQTGTSLVLNTNIIDRLRVAFASNQIRSACAGCEWESLCSSVAVGGFDGTVIKGNDLQSKAEVPFSPA